MKNVIDGMEEPQVLQPTDFTREDESVDLTERVYQYYALFGCDPERTALAANVPAEQVRKMASDGRWDQEFAVLVRLRQSGRPGDLERATNRAINFVQAHRLRLFLERVLRHFALISQDELHRLCEEIRVSPTGAESRKVNCRPFADLAAALEKCQAMTYAALCDTASDRNKRGETAPGDQSEVDAHVKIAGALQRMRLGEAKPPTEPPQAQE